MPKTIIFSAPQGDIADMTLTIDDTGRELTIDTGDGAGATECSIGEGDENQTADLFQALADQAGSLVPPPGRPSSFVRGWTLAEAELYAKITSEGGDWTPTRVVNLLYDGLDALKGAINDEDEKATAEHLTAMVAAMMALSHGVGARVGERIEKCVK